MKDNNQNNQNNQPVQAEPRGYAMCKYGGHATNWVDEYGEACCPTCNTLPHTQPHHQLTRDTSGMYRDAND